MILYTYSNLLEHNDDYAGKRKIHFLFSDGTEISEEYDLKLNLLLGR